MKSTLNGTTTTFVGNHYEISGSTITKYYYAGATRIAMRVNGTLSYLFSDHLGSTSVAADSSGAKVANSEIRYTAWGEVRYPLNKQNPGPSKYTYTGQYSNVDDFGLMYYGARWYDPALGRFNQPDTIIPQQSQGVQAWDRYAYTNNNPVRYNDPTGHCIFGGIDTVACIGFAIGAGVNLLSQYHKLQEGSIEKISLGEAAVAGTVGAAAAVTGAAIAVGAAAVGVATGSVLAELAVGSIASGTANVIFNNTQRVATDIVNGETVTAESVENNFEQNFTSDMKYGMLGYGIGKTFSSFGNAFWSPHELVENPTVFGDPLLSRPMGGVTDLLNMHPAQNILTGSASVIAQSVSNSTLIEFWHRHNLEGK